MEGFFELCSQQKETNHLLCSVGLRLLENLVMPGFCKYSNWIRDKFVTMHQNCLLMLKLESHIAQKKLIGCKRHSITLLNLYKTHNPTYDETKFMKDELSLSLFQEWQKRNRLNSVKCENLSIRKASFNTNSTKDTSSSNGSSLNLSPSPLLGSPEEPKIIPE